MKPSRHERQAQISSMFALLVASGPALINDTIGCSHAARAAAQTSEG